jgi:ubiquitin-protein ligase
MNKRFRKEVRSLYLQQSQISLLENDYLVYQDESNINILHTIIKAPYDSVYRHKFIRLDFEIPDNYPHSPPKVTFVNHDSVRIHPNMYQDGKCCSTILNTWPSENEKWTSSMGIETILLTFHSFLDNNPYTYEPGGRDDPSYTIYVQHQSWITCLIRYLQYEKIDTFKEYIYNYLLLNIDSIFTELSHLNETYQRGYYNTNCFEIENFIIDYKTISEKLQDHYNYIYFTENNGDAYEDEEFTFQMFLNKDFTCSICFDTNESEDVVRRQGNGENEVVTLECKHKFHKTCLKTHVQTNDKICPMCRKNIENEIEEIKEENEWIINPLTKRRVKIGSRTYKYLKENDVI